MDNIRENLLFREKKYKYVFISLIYNNNHYPNITSENCPDKSSKKGDAIISTTVPPSMNIPLRPATIIMAKKKTVRLQLPLESFAVVF